MKTLTLLICSLFFLTQLHAQKIRSAFRKGYQRIGISTLGNQLDNNLSPKENVFNGNYGATMGFVLETGHIYYFKSTKKATGKINYGLDWTIASITYNKLNGWDAYRNASGGHVEDPELSVSLASKLGPVVSFNPVEKLVIDARIQVAPVARFTVMDYYENEGQPNYRYFSFQSDDEENIEDVLSLDIGADFGISVRRKAIGLALDYTTVNANTSYEAYERQDNHSSGKEKIKTHCLQLKLSFTL